MRILVADKLSSRLAEALEEAGHEFDIAPNLTETDLPDAIADADVLVVRSTRVNATTVKAAQNLSLIIRAGAGVNTIDVAAASAAGIYVCNVPGRNAIAVAELTMGLILALDRDLPDATADLRAGRWDKARYSKSEGLHGRSLGLVGIGMIGLEVATRAAAFGLNVRAIKKPRDRETAEALRELEVELVADLDVLASTSDILSLHVPAVPATKQLIDEDLLAKMKPHAWIINTSRAELIDENALIRALDRTDMRAGLDVFADEPETKEGTISSKLASHPAVIGTHHIGGSTEQAQRSVAEGVAEVIAGYAAGDLINCVNLEDRDTGDGILTIRHLDRVGVLAKILSILRDEGLNVAQMTNQPFEGGVAAVATISVEGEVTPQLLDRLSEVDEVMGVLKT